ncbi:uroporphyrinogen decarboxylase [Thecamonas trahens ATCC 50062]|uniref:Uroporphyrinogen decarboxylase n=1 Tax=Thecamonas trahens ATCC 50062 TaxID=461836 RepID=A0A0L0DK07_THETB|nr:uroporphyrinogen decarboxylase [Thecamonas trahens ATCC 50062]KNC51653.1 uroporphyrinogen decarboxylase [Thecamonas trahens ATCC 50062]|eukprot:XP_013755791.1 uroporphyrinogen decarboxylase [Thecamonas trahens ATCC 50062]
MRQAGRYLPEYRAVSQANGFFNICRTPELACEVTLQPLRRFEYDASIIFSDILVVPQAMGMEVQMVKGKGPVFPAPLESPEDMQSRLEFKPDVASVLSYVYEAIALTRTNIGGAVPLIGFVGAPWTLMAYMIEGGGSKTHSKAKKWLYIHKAASHQLLQAITDVVVAHLVEQAKAGAQLLQVFDSNAGALTRELYDEFGLPYLTQIATRVKSALGAAAVPMTAFARGAHWALHDLSYSFYDVLSIDWTIDPEYARTQTGGRVALQGNIDPCYLYASDEDLVAAVGTMLSAFGPTGYICNLGHGIYPDMDPAKVKVFVDAVHAYDHTQRTLRIGTRSSLLALAQTREILGKLRAARPLGAFSVVRRETLGDLDQSRHLASFGEQGIFTKELEAALLDSAVDVLVHSLKDVPTKLPAGLELVAYSERSCPSDCVVFSRAIVPRPTSLADLPAGSVVGTSSLRRIAQLKRAYPGLVFDSIRGNIHTRLTKLDTPTRDPPYAAIILAVAGLNRVSLDGRIDLVLDHELCLPAVGQAAYGIEVRSADTDAAAQVRAAINHRPTEVAVVTERALLHHLEGGCKLPVGALATLNTATNELAITARVISLDGADMVAVNDSVSLTDALGGASLDDAADDGAYARVLDAARAFGVAVADALLADGADTILTKIRKDLAADAIGHSVPSASS